MIHHQDSHMWRQLTDSEIYVTLTTWHYKACLFTVTSYRREKSVNKERNISWQRLCSADKHCESFTTVMGILNIVKHICLIHNWVFIAYMGIHDSCHPYENSHLPHLPLCQRFVVIRFVVGRMTYIHVRNGTKQALVTPWFNIDLTWNVNGLWACHNAKVFRGELPSLWSTWQDTR